MKKIKAKEPIRLRQRLMASGVTSLYLDVYHNGKRTYEYLKLYLTPEKTKQDKIRNKETLTLAETIKSKRIVELMSGTYGFGAKKKRVLLSEFIESVIKEKGKELSKSTLLGWCASVRQMKKYEHRYESIFLDEIDVEWVNGLSQYLSNNNKQNTANLYFSKFITAMHEANKKGLISNNIICCSKKISRIEVQRDFLLIEELQRLIEAPCCDENVKNAFLFSCFTGLRVSDIRQIKWDDVFSDGETNRIAVRQKKTKELIYVDISDRAHSFMVRNDSEYVFPLPCQQKVNIVIDVWCLSVGIRKKITFHSARHTFACLLIDIGEDLYTVSKLLGHKKITTTQIYAKVVDKKRKNAIKKLGDLF